MPDTACGFDDMPILDMPAPPASVKRNARRRRLRSRLLRAGREAVDERELLELLLAGCHAGNDGAALAASLVERFGSASRALAARPDRLHDTPGLTEDAVAALKAAEALGIAMAREAAPGAVRPDFTGYGRVIDYCRALAGHGEVETFHLLFLDRKSRLIADERQQSGTVSHAPAFPREICIRALERQASALIACHNHPSADPTPSRSDIETTKRIERALKTIDVTLLDHVIVTPTAAFSFKEKGLL